MGAFDGENDGAGVSTVGVANVGLFVVAVVGLFVGADVGDTDGGNVSAVGVSSVGLGVGG